MTNDAIPCMYSLFITRLLELGEQLALVGSLEQSHPGLGDLLERGLDNVLTLVPNLELSLGNSLLEKLKPFGPLVGIVHDDEALDLNPHAHDLEPVLEAGDGVPGAVVVRDGSACSNTAVPRHARKHEVEDLAADVVEVDVCEVGSGFLQVGPERRGLVVQALVGPERLDPLAFGISARDTDHTLAPEELLGDLDGHAAGGTCCAGNHHDVFGRGTSDLGETAVSGQASESESAEVVRRAEAFGERRSRLDGARGKHDLLLPSRRGDDDVALVELGGRRLEDFGETAGAHDFALLDGGDVEARRVLHLAQPAALGGVVGEVEGLDEDVVVFHGAGLGLLESEGRVGAVNHGEPFGLVGQYPLASLDHGCGGGVSRVVCCCVLRLELGIVGAREMSSGSKLNLEEAERTGHSTKVRKQQRI